MAIKDLLLKLRLQGAKKTKEELKGVEGGIGKMGKAAARAGAAFFAARGLISGMKTSIELAGRFEKVNVAFENLSKASGFSSQALNKLKIATDGTINSIELMEQANNAMLLGIVDNENQMAEMFDISQRLASSLGQDTLFGVQSLVTGLGRQSKLMLDNLGIMIDVEKANKDYADVLGISSRQLSDQQRKQAFVNAAMSQARDLVKDLGEENLTATDHFNRLRTATDELRISFGTRFSKTIADATESLLKLGKSAFDTIQKFKFNVLNKDVKDFVKSLVDGSKQVIENGDLSKINQEINRFANLLEEFPQLAEVLKPAIKDLQVAADALRQSQQESQKIVETVSLSKKELEKFSQFASSASASLATSALMGDNLGQALKRVLAQQILITAQLKLQKFIQESLIGLAAPAGTFGGSILGGLKFLFGGSPTQASPSPNITINQTIKGGMVDHNFAANSIIPAINKAISTGQARINR